MVSAFSIGTSQRSTFQRPATYFVPGPGSYNAEKKQRQQAPAHRIGNSQRNLMLRTFAPGPGAYNPPPRMTKEGPNWSFGLKQQQLSSNEIMKTPGPGSYNPNNSVMQRSVPRFSMASKHLTHYDREGPGPGTYENKSTVVGVPSVRFNMAHRANFYENNKTPGPGTYIKQRPSSAGPRFGFGTSKRISLHSEGRAPGPGSYQANSMFQTDQKKGFSMIFRKTDTSLLEASRVPGPGTYNPYKLQRVQPPSYKIGNGPRDQFLKDLTPGPGTYESIDYENYKHSSSKTRIGSAQRRPLNEHQNNPGPGSYEIPSLVGEGPKPFLIGHKVETGPRELYQIPGPGQYHASMNFVKSRPASAKIGTSIRMDLLSSTEAPGVGNYNIQMQKKEGPSWGFGTMKRPALNDSKDTPGPGGYNIKPMFADVPKYLLPEK